LSDISSFSKHADEFELWSFGIDDDMITKIIHDRKEEAKGSATSFFDTFTTKGKDVINTL